jgi:hypothetical protein
MLVITIAGEEYFDDSKQEFIKFPSTTISLEHSLVSLSKWESKWCKPFLKTFEEKTDEETLDYIRCMTLTKNVKPEIYYRLTSDQINKINNYIEAPMTATTFPSNKSNKSREIITAELIYYWMVAMAIPFECQKWHLNRLLTLINVCNIKNNPPKKGSRAEIIERNKALNAARRKQFNTNG